MDSRPSLIIPFVWLGSELTSCNLEELISKDIRYICNLSWPRSPSHFEQTNQIFQKHFQYLNCEIYETTTNIRDYFQLCFPFLEKARSEERGVLIHCKSGNTRSAVFCIAYLMTLYGVSLRKAYFLVKSKRNNITVNDNFLGQLLEYQAEILPDYDPEEEDQTIEVTTKTSSNSVLSLSTLLLLKHSDGIQVSCTQLINNNKWLDLQRIIEELNQHSKFMNIFRKELFSYLKTLCLKTVEPFLQQSPKKPSEYINSVWNLIQEFRNINDLLSHPPLERIFELTSSFLISKVPLASQYINKYAHDMLSKGLRIRFDEKFFEKIGLLTCYLTERASFEGVYVSNLSKRLLGYLNDSTEWETQMVSSFKQFGLIQFAEKLENLLKDVSLSQDVSNQFQNYLQSSQWKNSKISFKAKTLSSSHWNNSSKNLEGQNENSLLSQSNYILPTELQNYWQSFQEFYKFQFPGRKIQLVSHLGSAEIISEFGKKKYFLTVSPEVMVILDLFNDVDQITFSEMQFVVRMDEVTLQKTLLLLTQETPLLKKISNSEQETNSNSKAFLPSDSFTINQSFSSKSSRIRIPK